MKPTRNGDVDVRGRLGAAFGPGEDGGLAFALGVNELATDEG
jgi:hypothetical protein